LLKLARILQKIALNNNANFLFHRRAGFLIQGIFVII
jgi:hypothetical protein